MIDKQVDIFESLNDNIEKAYKDILDDIKKECHAQRFKEEIKTNKEKALQLAAIIREKHDKIEKLKDIYLSDASDKKMLNDLLEFHAQNLLLKIKKEIYVTNYEESFHTKMNFFDMNVFICFKHNDNLKKEASILLRILREQASNNKEIKEATFSLLASNRNKCQYRMKQYKRELHKMSLLTIFDAIGLPIMLLGIASFPIACFFGPTITHLGIKLVASFATIFIGFLMCMCSSSYDLDSLIGAYHLASVNDKSTEIFNLEEQIMLSNYLSPAVNSGNTKGDDSEVEADEVCPHRLLW